MSPGDLGCSALRSSGVHTKFGIDVVTSQEQGGTGSPKEGEAAQVGDGFIFLHKESMM